jgi:hypothetical protein
MARIRYSAEAASIRVRDLPAAALRAVLREGYRRADLKADLLAGLVFDMVIAVAVGVGLAALLFMKRMAEITHARLTSYDEPAAGAGCGRRPDRERRTPDPRPAARQGRGLRDRRSALLRRGATGHEPAGRGRRKRRRRHHPARRARTGDGRHRPGGARERARRAVEAGQHRHPHRLAAQPQALLDKAGFKHKRWRLVFRPDMASAIAAAQSLLALASPADPTKTVVDAPRI